MSSKKPNSMCQMCRSPFWVKPSQKRHGRGRFCSNSCKGRYGRSLQSIVGDKNPAWKGGIWKENTKAAARKWSEENPEKRRAHHAVEQALKSGKLSRLNCEHCGANRHLDAHHEDYSKPLDVKWMCRSCHLKAHRS